MSLVCRAISHNPGDTRNYLDAPADFVAPLTQQSGARRSVDQIKFIIRRVGRLASPSGYQRRTTLGDNISGGKWMVQSTSGRFRGSRGPRNERENPNSREGKIPRAEQPRCSLNSVSFFLCFSCKIHRIFLARELREFFSLTPQVD